MSEVAATSAKKFSAYRLFGWVPLLVTVLGATAVVVFSILRDM